MKLTIKSGESVDHAIQYLTEFLLERKEEYPLLKGNMNVYVTLEGFGHRNCPENEKEYILTDEQPIDVELSQLLAKKNEAKEGWKRYLAVQAKKVQSAASAVDLDIRYLETAEGKGRKPETIERRKAQLERNQTDLAQAKEWLELVQSLNEILNQGKIKWYFEKAKSSKSPYTYTITPYIIFEDGDGDNWHFVGFQSRYETAYGTLREGLPHNYQATKEQG